MGGTKCSYTGCKNYTGSKVHRFHRFPVSDQEKCLKWVEACNNERLLARYNLNQPKQFKTNVVCSDHFLATDYDETRKSCILKLEACPIDALCNTVPQKNGNIQEKITTDQRAVIEKNTIPRNSTSKISNEVPLKTKNIPISLKPEACPIYTHRNTVPQKNGNIQENITTQQKASTVLESTMIPRNSIGKISNDVRVNTTNIPISLKPEDCPIDTHFNTVPQKNGNIQENMTTHQKACTVLEDTMIPRNSIGKILNYIPSVNNKKISRKRTASEVALDTEEEEAFELPDYKTLYNQERRKCWNLMKKLRKCTDRFNNINEVTNEALDFDYKVDQMLCDVLGNDSILYNMAINLNKVPNNRKYSLAEKNLFIALYLCSSKGYRLFRENFPAPSPQIIKNWLDEFELGAGLNEAAFEELKNMGQTMNDKDKIISLSFDATSKCEYFSHYSRSDRIDHQIVTNYDENEQDDLEEEAAVRENNNDQSARTNDVLVFTVKGIDTRNRLKQSLGYFIHRDSLSSEDQAELVRKAVKRLKKSGFSVNVLCCENATSNIKHIKGVYEEESFIEIDGDKILCMFDCSLLIKSDLRNNLPIDIAPLVKSEELFAEEDPLKI